MRAPSVPLLSFNDRPIEAEIVPFPDDLSAWTRENDEN